MEANDPMEQVSRTIGLTGASDTVLVLDHKGGDTVLHGRGRDVEEFEKALSFDTVTGRWSELGDAADVHRSNERSKILEAVADLGVCQPKEVADLSGMASANVRKLLRKMLDAGEVGQSGGKYYVPGHTGHSSALNCDRCDHHSRRPVTVGTRRKLGITDQL